MSQLFGGCVSNVAYTGRSAIAQYNDTIGNIKYFVQTMTNVDHANATRVALRQCHVLRNAHPFDQTQILTRIG